jgi:hypothetical protein
MDPQQIEQTESPKSPRRVIGSRARRGRPKGSRNKRGHHAGRPRKHPVEVFHPSIWSSGRAEISVEQKHIDEALRANSSHCAIAMAIADAVPNARRISVDLQTIRWTDSKKGVRYCFLTPSIAQTDVIIPFDQGEVCKPVTFRMKPAFVTRVGAGFARHTPEPDQLKGTGLKVAEDQPHIPSASEAALAEIWKPKSVGPMARWWCRSTTGRPSRSKPDQSRHASRGSRARRFPTRDRMARSRSRSAAGCRPNRFWREGNSV